MIDDFRETSFKGEQDTIFVKETLRVDQQIDMTEFQDDPEFSGSISDAADNQGY